MMKKRTAIIFTCKGKILLVKRRKGDLNYYCFPGGTIEKNEDITEAMKREIQEELSYNIVTNPRQILYLNKKDLREESFYFYQELKNTFKPKLSIHSPEFKKISDKYLFQPIWVNYAKIKKLSIFPVEIKTLLMKVHPELIKEIIYLP